MIVNASHSKVETSAVINADYCSVYGSNSIVNGDYCDVIGSNSLVNGDYCHVSGSNCTINGDHCNITGSNCTINGNYCNVTGANSQKSKSTNIDGSSIGVIGEVSTFESKSSPHSISISTDGVYINGKKVTFNDTGDVDSLTIEDFSDGSVQTVVKKGIKSVRICKPREARENFTIIGTMSVIARSGSMYEYYPNLKKTNNKPVEEEDITYFDTLDQITIDI